MLPQVSRAAREALEEARRIADLNDLVAFVRANEAAFRRGEVPKLAEVLGDLYSGFLKVAGSVASTSTRASKTLKLASARTWPRSPPRP